ncbi:MAG TPA: hypothetical protein PKW28_09975 [Turneriella sp.]|nr:hypothetical protein [Turneriella sp.]HNJ66213.1 hypothetical protein [Turneriella sp.]HNN01808.1 hypothetical protein [Turneriella sp.]
MIPAAAVELEQLVLTIRHAGAELLNMEMYERWGHGSDSAMNKKMEQAGFMREVRTNAGAQLAELVRHYRREQPEAVEYWANGHLQLLQYFLQNVTDSTARYVAEEETAAWRALLAGKRDIVEENTYYVHPDAELHAKLFGKLEIPALYRDA